MYDLDKDTVGIKDVDIVVCSMVAHHIRNFEQLISQIKNMLKKGGKVHYLGLADKTKPEKEMTFKDVHKHPPFHGREFLRSHETIKNEISTYFIIKYYERIGPGLLYLHAVK